MEITSTVITKTAHHISEKGAYNIDYIISNGKLDRVQLSIFQAPEEGGEEVYLGAVNYDRGNITCIIPWGEDAARYFETAMEFIAEIIENVGIDDQPEEQEESTEKKSR